MDTGRLGMNLRSYGLPKPDKYVDGPPRIREVAPFDCPSCKGQTLFTVEITIKDHPLLKGGNGIGLYIGCAACPFASPCVMVSRSSTSSTERNEEKKQGQEGPC